MEKLQNVDIVYENNNQLRLECNKPNNPNFLNRAMPNPWKSNVPQAFPYLKNSRNYIYNLLDYNVWKHFTKDFVIKFFKIYGGDLSKNKRWRDLYGYFCIYPTEKVACQELKYIYECIYEMPSSAIPKLLENLRIRTLTERREPFVPPILQKNQFPLDLVKFRNRIDAICARNASIVNVRRPNQVGNRMQGDVLRVLKGNQEISGVHATNPGLVPMQQCVFKQPNSRTSTNSKTIRNRNSTVIIKKAKVPFQEPAQASSSSQEVPQRNPVIINEALQPTEPYSYLHSSLGINSNQQVPMNIPSLQLPQNYSIYIPNTAVDNKVRLPQFRTQFGDSLPQFRSFGPYENISNFDVDELGDIVFVEQQNTNNNQNNNGNSK